MVADILLKLAAEHGAPRIEQILREEVGGRGGELGARVVDSLARAMGAPPGELHIQATDRTDEFNHALDIVETSVPEMVALHEHSLALQTKLLELEGKGPTFAWAWRAAWMWLLGFAWFWHMILLPLINGVTGLEIVPMDGALLFQISGVVMGLYMGGHTVKDVAKRLKPGVV